MLSEEERDQGKDTRAINANLDMYELAKEASAVLELTLWRLKIDKSVVSGYNSGKGSQKRAKVGNHISQRNQCRINCGADVVIPGVLRYLEPK